MAKRMACEECSGTGVAYIGEYASASICPACRGYASVEVEDEPAPVKVVNGITVYWCKALNCYVTIPASER